jgi:hypothetical protein
MRLYFCSRHFDFDSRESEQTITEIYYVLLIKLERLIEAIAMPRVLIPGSINVSDKLKLCCTFEETYFLSYSYDENVFRDAVHLFFFSLLPKYNRSTPRLQ